MTTILFHNLAARASQPLAGPQARPAPSIGIEPPPIPGRPEPGSPNGETAPRWKIVLAFFLGVIQILQAYLLTVVLAVVVGGELGAVGLLTCAVFIGSWVCFFITQFVLSHGNPRAARTDWPVIAALNCAPFCSVILFWVFATQLAGLAILVVASITLACSYAGAALAGLIARRRSPLIPPTLC